LTVLFDAKARGVLVNGIREMAKVGRDRMHDLIVMNTPVETGNLRTSWYTLPTIKREDTFISVVATDVDYAPYVEFGTGLWGPKHAKYEILPKTPGGVLAWQKGGQWVYATKVMHPGSPGHHMVAIGTHVLEMEIEGGLFEPTLAKMAADIEALAERQA
jgi:hypothetical protein